MSHPSDGPTNPHALTPQQAMDLLHLLAPGAVMLLLAVPVPQERSPASPQPHQPTEGAAPHGLERFVVEGPKLLPKLITFYFIGRAFSNGAKSLHDVSKELRRRKETKMLTPNPPHSVSALSVLLTDLAAIPFAGYLRKPYPTLLAYSEGRPGVLSADGWTAWQATRDYLTLRNMLPDWSGPSD